MSTDLSTPICGGNDVKQDMGLMRKILLAIQQKNDLEYSQIIIEGEDEKLVGRHIEMLYDNGFIEGIGSASLADEYKKVAVKDLSFKGHQFLSDISKEEVWNNLKEKLGSEGLSGLSLDVLRDVAKSAASEWIKKKLGLS